MIFRLPDEYKKILRELPQPQENPFYLREQRADTRHGEPFRTLLNSTLVLGIIFGLCLYLIWFLLRYNVFPSIFLNERIPAWLGGQDGGRSIFAVVAATHALYVYFTARILSNRVLTGELQRGTLFQLIMSRIGAFETVAQITVYPFQQAVLVTLGGLPIYAILMGFGSVGIHEVVCLMALLFTMSFAVPVFRAPGMGELSPEEVGQKLRDQSRANGCISGALITLLLPGTSIAGALAMFIHMTNPSLFQRIPSDVWPALPAFPITFMWVIVRILTASFTFYGLPIPPWIALCALAIFVKIGKLWKSSLFLRIYDLRQYFRHSEYPAINRWTSDTVGLILVVAIGYFWTPLVESGMGAQLWNTGGTGLRGNLSGSLYLMMIFGYVPAVFTAFKISGTPISGRDTNREQVAKLLMCYVPFAFAFVGSCLTSPMLYLSALPWLAIGLCLPLMAIHLNLIRRFELGAAVNLLGGSLAGLLLVSIVKVIPLFSAISFVAVPWFSNPNTLARLSGTQGIPSWTIWLISVFAATSLFQVCKKMERTGYFEKARKELERRTAVVQLNPERLRSNLTSPLVTKGAIAIKLPDRIENQPVAAPPVIDIVSIMEQPDLAKESKLSVPLSQIPQGTAGNTRIKSETGRGSEWRWRPLTPIGAAVMRRLYKLTDNPVALYSARRTLPGSLQNDQIVFGLIALGVAMAVVNYLPRALSLLVYPSVLSATIFPPPILSEAVLEDQKEIITGLTLLIATLVGIPMISTWNICRAVTESFRAEREKSTLGFLLLTPLSSRGVAIGHCLGSLLPSIAIWIGAFLAAIAPTVWLGSIAGYPFAFAGFAYGFFLAIFYTFMCTVTGLWIGITEANTRDVTIGIYLLPLSFCVIGAGCAFYTWRYWNWGFYAYNALFVVITLGILIYMWRSAIKELNSMRIGDVPFEGRVVSS